MLDNDRVTRRELLLAEFNSLRAESASAKKNQQSIFQWSLAAITAVWATSAALSAAGPILFVSLGIVIPVLAASGFAAWIGEVHRMERAGRYLRARELAFNNQPMLAVSSPMAPAGLPIMWESLIYDDRARQNFGKDVIGSVGAIFLFTAAFYLSWFGSLFMVRPDDLQGSLSADFVSIVIFLWLTLAPIAFPFVFGPVLFRLGRLSHGRLPDPTPLALPPDVSLDIVMPCRDESSALLWVSSRIPAGSTAILIDNGSSDYSGEIAKRLQFSVITTTEFVNIGDATQLGIATGTSDYVCVMDCDGTVDPAEVLKLLAPLVDGSSDMVIGIRKFNLRHPELWHWFLMFVRARMLKRRFGRGAPTQIGSMRVFRRDALSVSTLAGLAGDKGWSLDLTLTMMEAVGSDRVSSITIPYAPRVGNSKITGTVAGALRAGLDSRRVIRSRPRRPLKPWASEVVPDCKD